MSLGVNNIPPKVCSYSCVYCQLGVTASESIDRVEYYSPELIYDRVTHRVDQVASSGGKVDYITFVPDGEPTLDVNLGKEIELIQNIGIPVAVISNASLIWRQDVRDDLLSADWVSLKVDSADNGTWGRVNRPSRELGFASIKEGEILFSENFDGELSTETMLVSGLNDDERTLEETAMFISEISPKTAYISVPTRPPAEPWVRPPDENKMNAAYQIFKECIGEVELITGSEGTNFTYTGDIRTDILGIASVHPIRREGLIELLKRSGYDWSIIEGMISEGLLREVEYRGEKFYIVRHQG